MDEPRRHTPESDKRVIRAMIDDVWTHGRTENLGLYWAADCINHAAAAGAQQGLPALTAYHEAFKHALAPLSEVVITVQQQIAEGGRVVTQLVTTARHTGEFMGIAPTSRPMSLATIRIDRLQAGKIVEHWSVADVAGLLQQIGTPADTDQRP